MCDDNTMDQTELHKPTTAVERPRVATVTYTTQPAPTTNAVATPYPEKAGRSLSTVTCRSHATVCEMVTWIVQFVATKTHIVLEVVHHCGAQKHILRW